MHYRNCPFLLFLILHSLSAVEFRVLWLGPLTEEPLLLNEQSVDRLIPGYRSKKLFETSGMEISLWRENEEGENKAKTPLSLLGKISLTERYPKNLLLISSMSAEENPHLYWLDDSWESYPSGSVRFLNETSTVFAGFVYGEKTVLPRGVSGVYRSVENVNPAVALYRKEGETAYCVYCLERLAIAGRREIIVLGAGMSRTRIDAFTYPEYRKSSLLSEK